MKHSPRFLRTLLAAILIMLFASSPASADVGGICAEGVDYFNHGYTLTGNGASDIIAVALAQKGKSGEALRYHTDWGGWCAAFVNDCAYLAGQSAAIPFRSGATHDVVLLRQYILNNGGTAVSSPQKGDIVFYHDGARYFHVGMMIDSSNTIQGNVNNLVYQMTSPWKLDGSYSVSYVRPAYTNITKAYLDVNGILDSRESGSLEDYGTCDVYINGSLTASGVSDYYTSWPVGTTYQIKNIRPAGDHTYNGSASYSGTIGQGGVSIRLSFISYGLLSIKGLLDGEEKSSLSGFGSCDVYINGSADAADAAAYSKKWPAGTAFEVRNVKALTGYGYAAEDSGPLQGTIAGGKTSSVKLVFMTDAVLTGEWQESEVLPRNVNTDLCEIQYQNIYRKTAVDSPGEDWTKTGTGSTVWQNTGGVYESDFELATSESRVCVGSYYYHYCGASTGVNVEHYNDGTHTDYHSAGDITQFYVGDGPWTDDNDARYLAYKIKWRDGQWKDGWATCAAGRSAIWYRRYQYQDRKAVTSYVWTRTGDWTSETDPSADSVRYRFRLKDQDDPVLSWLKVTEVTPRGCVVTCRVTDDSCVAGVRFESWSDSESSSSPVVTEIIPEGTLKEAEVSAQIPISAHDNERDLWYHIRVTAFDPAGHVTGNQAAECSVFIPTLVRSARRRLVLPGALERIEESAFESMNEAGEIILPDGASSIGSRAFADCSRLVLVYIPDSVQSIAEDAFSGSTNVVLLCESLNDAAVYAQENRIPYLTGE